MNVVTFLTADLLIRASDGLLNTALFLLGERPPARRQPLSGAEWEVLWCLFRNGATWDGNIPSKSGRDSLIERDLAYRNNGWTNLTTAGFKRALAEKMDQKKGT